MPLRSSPPICQLRSRPSRWNPTVSAVRADAAFQAHVDADEVAALTQLVEACPDTTVIYEPAPSGAVVARGTSDP